MSVEIIWTCDNPIDYREHVWRQVTSTITMPANWGMDDTGRLLCPTCWGLR